MSDQSDTGPDEFGSQEPSPASVVDIREYRQARDPLPVTFHRRELDAILWIYGRMVGEGAWRDYAIDHLKDRAVFSVFKRSGEFPLYRMRRIRSSPASRAPSPSSARTAASSSAATS